MNPEDDSEFLSGLWIGEAVPDPFFKDFFIPTNPIAWNLTVLNSASNTGTIPTQYDIYLYLGTDSLSCFGSGFFSDSGDIPGSPLLFFTLSGKSKSDPSNLTMQVEITKEYQESKETEGRLQLLMPTHVQDILCPTRGSSHLRRKRINGFFEERGTTSCLRPTEVLDVSNCFRRSLWRHVLVSAPSAINLLDLDPCLRVARLVLRPDLSVV